MAAVLRPFDNASSRTGRLILAISVVLALVLGMVGVRPAAAVAFDTFSIGDQPKVEGNTGATTITFNVTRTGSGPASVSYTTSNGPAPNATGGPAAGPGVDYQSTSGTLSYATGETTRPITVTIFGDSTDEPDEHFTVTLTPGATDSCTPDCTAVGTIQDDDGPTIDIDNPAPANEGNVGTTPVTFHVRLSTVSPDPVTVQYATSDAAATAGDSDYAAQSGTVTFTSGDVDETVTILVNGDTKDEANENFFVNLSNPNGGSIIDADGEALILNDDTPTTMFVDDLTVAEGAGTANVVVHLFAPSGKPVTVQYSTTSGTAVAPGDYTAVTNGTVTFAPGATTANAPVAIVNDALNEANETFTVTLSSPTTGVTFTDNSATVTITDDDAQPTVAIFDAGATEGNPAPATNDTFTVTLSAPTSKTVTVPYSTSNGTATAGEDYTTTSGTLTFTPGTTSQQIVVPVIGDTRNEAATETFTVTLGTPVNAGAGDLIAGGTITDDDAAPSLSINDITLAEGTGAGPTNFVFTVTLSAISGQAVTVNYATADATAIAGADYTSTSGTLTFNPGVTTQTITVPVAADAVSEADESFQVNLAGSTNASILKPQGIGTITNDDAGPIVSITDVSVTEGSSGTVNALFAVTLSAASAQTITIPFATVDGSASSPSDYTATSGTLTFTPGQTSQNISVTVKGDAVPENSETFTVHLGTTTGGATYGKQDGIGTISTDDGPAPTLVIDDVTHNEGNAATTAYTFTVTRTGNLAGTVTVDYTTTPDTATAPSDYTAKTGTLTFAPTVATQQFTIDAVGDTTFEPTEAFKVTLSNPQNASISDSEGIGTITNDDTVPVISVDDVTLTEGNSGAKAFTFTLTLSNASSTNVTVDVATGLGTAQANDITAVPTTQITFTPGVVSQQVTVNVIGDTTDENNETFFLNLSSPVGATTTDTGVGTITNDDTAPGVSINSPTVSEGDSGTTVVDFTITLSAASGKSVTVTATTADGTATAPSDYTAKTQNFTFLPGQTTNTFTVLGNGDNTNEPDETFTVALSAATNVSSTGAAGTGTLSNDDAVPSITVADITAVEGDAGPTNATFTLTLSNPSSTAITVSVATADGTATSADYTPLAATTVTFAPGVTTQPVVVAVIGDTIDEPNETFVLNLTTPSGATIADNQGTATITDDDGTPSISIADITATEGDAGTTNATFTLTLSNPSSSVVTVSVATADGTATSADYTPLAATTVTFPIGTTTQPVVVAVKGDVIDEPNETFFLNLSSPSGATIADNQGIATITDDDGTPSISIADITATEGDAGTTNATFTLTLSNPRSTAITVSVATADGTATSADYTPLAATTVTFPAGSTTQPVVVAVKGDVIDEPNETFVLNLTTPSGATIADNQGTATITDDDGTPSISIADITATEGNAGTTNATFTVSLSNPSSSAVTVSVATADGTATSADYTPLAATTVTFPAGSTTQPVVVAVKGDVIDEVNETFFLNLSSPSGATIADSQGMATITDDDGTPTIAIADASVTEGNTGTKTVTFVVSQSAASGQAVTVSYATGGGTATAGTDYTAASGTVTIPAGQTSNSFTVTVTGDTTDEVDETFNVVLSAPTNATIADGTGVGTITDDDDPAPVTPTAAPQGYSLVGEDGSLYAFGTAKNLGDMRGKTLNAPIIGVAYTPGGNGYWLVAKDGGIFTFGDADFFGSMGGSKINSPVIGMAATPSGKGYWLFAGDGGIFTFGDAEFFGSMGDQKLNAPVINMEPLASGRGYWLVAADGGIFTFGLGDFFGSMGDQKINQPVFDMTSTDTDHGYWLVARDGGIFSFGDAGPKFFGSAVNETPKPTKIIGMDSTPGSQGYWIADADGKVYRYGDAQDLGDRYLNANPAPMVAFATVPSLKP